MQTRLPIKNKKVFINCSSMLPYTSSISAPAFIHNQMDEIIERIRNANKPFGALPVKMKNIVTKCDENVYYYFLFIAFLLKLLLKCDLCPHDLARKRIEKDELDKNFEMKKEIINGAEFLVPDYEHIIKVYRKQAEGVVDVGTLRDKDTLLVFFFPSQYYF